MFGFRKKPEKQVTPTSASIASSAAEAAIAMAIRHVDHSLTEKRAARTAIRKAIAISRTLPTLHLSFKR